MSEVDVTGTNRIPQVGRDRNACGDAGKVGVYEALRMS